MLTKTPDPKVAVPAGAGRKNKIQLVAISCVSLFLELAMIRFINSSVQIIAYFNNFLIISAFLGLGLGSSLVPRRRNLLAFFPAIFFLVTGLLVTYNLLELTSGFHYNEPGTLADNVIWATYNPKQNIPPLLTILLLFSANLLFFIPLGNKLGDCLDTFENRLEAYGYDLAGSILGVIAFTSLSFLGLPPVVWFSISALVLLWLMGGTLKQKAVAGALFVAAIYLTTLPVRGIWSPYYKVTARTYLESPAASAPVIGYGILVDGLRIQDALDFNRTVQNPEIQQYEAYYELPFRFSKAKKILILGAGCGNDASIALRYSPERIDVVEIDPVILRFGSTLHPQRPYRDSRVRIMNDDARAFVRRTNDSYDLIVMNALDSHHQLPGLSTLRLESYVYTVEAFRDVGNLMHQNSFFIINLMSTRRWMGERVYWSLKEAFGREPQVFTSKNSPYDSQAFVVGPSGWSPEAPSGNATDLIKVDLTPFKEARESVQLSTDDWPHLYLKAKRLPHLYLYILGLVAALTFIIFRNPLKNLGESASLHFFLLGAAFMLLETRSITKVALLFGSTWIVNAIVILSILIVIFIGNLLLLKNFRIPKAVGYSGIFASLLFVYFVPVNFILGYGVALRVVLTAVWVGLPIFFASLVFSASFRKAGSTSSAFAANLLGVGIGGILEYSSMIYGLSFIYLLALLLYFFALLTDPTVARSGTARLAFQQ